MQPATRRQAFGAAVLLGVVALAALALSPARTLGALDALSARPLAFGAVLVACYLLRPLVAWPISLFSALLGYVYGPVAFPAALAGAVLTCLPPYALARATGDEGALGRAGATGRRYFGATGDTRGIVVARLLPLPADPVSYGAGLSGVPLGAYALGTALGETPWTIAAVLVGSSMSAFAVEGLDAGLPLLVGATALAALLVVGPLYRHWRGPAVTDSRRPE